MLQDFIKCESKYEKKRKNKREKPVICNFDSYAGRGSFVFGQRKFGSR